MSLIRLNWFTLVKIVLIAFVVFIFQLIISILFRVDLPSLEYDYSKREFSIKLSDDYLEIGNKIESNVNARVYSDFYLIDQNVQQKIEQNDSKNKVQFQIKSARFVYSNIPLDNWVEYIENIVKLGLNTIEIEIIWALHEPYPKNFEFKQKNLDLEEFIKLVKYYKLFLIVRIDPYLPCSDYDLGGLPHWLLSDVNLESRETTKSGGILSLHDSVFKEAFENYLNQLLPILSNYQLINNGPIIGLLIQNYNNSLSNQNVYFKFYGDKYKYLIERLLYYYDFKEAILKSVNMCDYCRYHDKINYENYCDPNFNIYLPVEYNKIEYQSDFQYCIDKELSKISQNNKTFSRIEEVTMLKSILFKTNLKELLDLKKSFSINRFYCSNKYDFLKDGTYYEYENNECLVDETGYLTDKYNLAFRLIKYNKFYKNIPIKTYNYNTNNSYQISKLKKNDFIDISMTHFLPYEKLINNLHSPIDIKPSKENLYIEYINIAYSIKTLTSGYILYRLPNINLKAGSTVFVKTAYIRDYAIILCDFKNHLLTIDHSNNSINRNIQIKLKYDCSNFHVLVENTGRSSYLKNGSHFSSQRKGILVKDAIIFKRFGKKNLEIGAREWKINIFDFLPKFFNRITFNSEYLDYNAFKNSDFQNTNAPMLAYAKFDVFKTNSKQSMFLLLNEWNKGAVFINGHNLGRYWNKGPFLTLHIPNMLLNNGSNEIIVFELHGTYQKQPIIYFSKSHVLI